MLLGPFLRILRPEQWYKSILVFLSMFFSINLFSLELYPRLIIGFIMLSLVSSIVYILNDIADYEKDRFHPEKKMRPIASGQIQRKSAVAYAIILGIPCFIVSYHISFGFFVTLVSLFAVAQVYNLYFKNIVIADVLTIAIGYVLRAVSGAVLINVRVSPWLIVGIFFAATLLALGKRKNEMLLLSNRLEQHKPVLIHYSNMVTDQAIAIASTLVILTYAMYSMTGPLGDSRLVLTLPLVTFMVLRYSFLLYKGDAAVRNPHRLFRDRPLAVTAIVHIVVTVILLYFLPYPFL